VFENSSGLASNEYKQHQPIISTVMFQHAPNHVRAQADDDQGSEFDNYPTDSGHNRQASHRDQKRSKLLSES
jgi:hypothetical protein